MWRGLGRRNSSHFLKSNPENKFGRENKTVVDSDSGAGCGAEYKYDEISLYQFDW